ncbi:dipeptidase [Arcobacter nitrofigilis DSM 7299]|uniref:Dipeptidase n=1 Tax=Arcobacter nitrofigilis (strain ATCC 33309 / DSM 7299 / CCUG 15893 / LMG 7604 / NCTC 12251 / CI) TaxID=572480 RepID=D5V5E5_ARCNC|nr:dipeptidase PepV [Arcobacter nitrofigilis]ADG93080.1 dipeptidase [Arcobacter nitrofigilis DSM 7299]
MLFTNILENIKDEIINKTQELVQIKSVETLSKPGMPFGEGVNEALEYTLKLCKDLGFKIKNFDGYAGHADLGEGDEMIGILVHLDVVPEGDLENWTYPPYSATIKNNRIYGRGTIDDKGPTIAAIYAMKALKDSGVLLKKKIRIIFGTDEESGWECMRYYLKKEKAPQIAFTPDANFPVIYGEKGIITLKLKQEFNVPSNSKINIKYIRGGELSNIVPNYCEALLYIKNEPSSIYEECLSLIKKEKYSIDLHLDNNNLYLKSHGVSAHAMEPQKGKNAISQLMQVLKVLNLESTQMNSFIDFYNNKINTQTNGESLNCQMNDKDSGELTLNVGIIDFCENKGELTLNIRYPVTKKDTMVIDKINANLINSNIKMEIINNMPPLYMPKDSKLVKTLTSVYKKMTNDDTQAQTFGGGTYARALDNAVAFGPIFPGQVNLAHQTDEFIEIDDLIKNAQIMAQAIYELDLLD